jgi:hypothetical protein
MVDPITGTILVWLGEWTTTKMAESLLGGVTNKLTKTDVEKALKSAAKKAEDRCPFLFQQLFLNCSRDHIKQFLNEFFQGAALAEFQKPLNDRGKPDIAFLVKAFQKAVSENEKVRGRIEDEAIIRDWLNVFVDTYFQQTANYLHFQVAKEKYF